MHITAFAASHRPASLNDALMREAVACLRDICADWTIDHHPYAMFDTPLFNDAQRESDGFPTSVDALHENVSGTDGWLISVPEYNWSIPGSLKNMIDWLSCYRPTPFAGTHALLMCATPSQRGGVMGLTHTKTVLEALGVHVFHSAFMLGDAHSHLTQEGLHTEKKREELRGILTRFASFAQPHHAANAPQ